MQCVDSDYAALLGIPPAKRKNKLWRDALIAAVVLIGGGGGGASVGYFIGVQQTRQDMLAEIQRMQISHQFALDLLSGKVSRAADVVTEAASSVEAAQRGQKTQVPKGPTPTQEKPK